MSSRSALGWCVLVIVSVGALLRGASASEIGAIGELPVSDPVNLQVLPKNLSRQSVRKLMKAYTRELGVTCAHCHVEDPQTQTLDYVSDDKPTKQTARIMIAMLMDINDKYVARLGRDPKYSVPVTCGSCHQGQSTPPAFEAGES